MGKAHVLIFTPQRFGWNPYVVTVAEDCLEVSGRALTSVGSSIRWRVTELESNETFLYYGATFTHERLALSGEMTIEIGPRTVHQYLRNQTVSSLTIAECEFVFAAESLTITGEVENNGTLIVLEGDV